MRRWRGCWMAACTCWERSGRAPRGRRRRQPVTERGSRLADLVTTGAALMCSMGTARNVLSHLAECRRSDRSGNGPDNARRTCRCSECVSRRRPRGVRAMGAPQPCTQTIAAPWSRGRPVSRSASWPPSTTPVNARAYWAGRSRSPRPGRPRPRSSEPERNGDGRLTGEARVSAEPEGTEAPCR